MTGRTGRLLFLVAGVCLAASDTIGATDGLGRLFFTPERRATLDRQRQFNIQEVRTLEGATVSLDGIVRRKREGVTGVQAVLLYPMNALANDPGLS